MRTNTATAILAFVTAPFMAFRRAFFPRSDRPRRLDEVKARERGHSLAIYCLFVMAFLLFELEPAFLAVGINLLDARMLERMDALLVFMAAFMAFQFLASYREPLVEPKKIMSADFREELVNGIRARDHSLTIDFIAYTSETLEKALDGLRDAVSAGRQKLKKLEVRVLVWDGVSAAVLPCILDHTKPCGANRRIDSDYRLRTYQKIAEHTHKVLEIGSQIRRICDMSPEQCKIEVRYSPFEPSFKALIVNSTTTFFSIYPIEEVPQSFPNQAWPNLDHEARVMVLEELPNGSMIFRAAEDWFNKVWDGFAVQIQPPWPSPSRTGRVVRQSDTHA